MGIKDFLSTLLKQKQEENETKIQVKQIVVEIRKFSIYSRQPRIRARIRRRQFRHSSTRTRTQHCH